MASDWKGPNRSGSGSASSNGLSTRTDPLAQEAEEAAALVAEMEREDYMPGMWPTPTTAPERPNEGNVRLLRAKVLAGEMTEEEARSMLNGKDPFSAQGKLPAVERPMWRTPTTMDASGEFVREGKKLSGRTPQDPQVNLADQVADEDRRMWPTPTTSDGMGGPGSQGREGGDNLRTAVDPRTAARRDEGDGEMSLFDVEAPAPKLQERWPTPTANDPINAGYMLAKGKKYPTLPGATGSSISHYDPEKEGRLYPSPVASDADRASEWYPGEHNRTLLGDVKDRERWPTPMSRDWKDTGDLSNTPDNGYLARVVSSDARDGQTTSASSSPTPGGSLNPTWVSWLMGFPLTWLHDSPEETASEVSKYLGSPEPSPSGSAS